MSKIWMLNRMFTQKYLVNFLLHTVDRIGAMSVKFAQIPNRFYDFITKFPWKQVVFQNNFLLNQKKMHFTTKIQRGIMLYLFMLILSCRTKTNKIRNVFF